MTQKAKTPTAEQRKLVETMAAVGIPSESICLVIGVSGMSFELGARSTHYLQHRSHALRRPYRVRRCLDYRPYRLRRCLDYQPYRLRRCHDYRPYRLQRPWVAAASK